MEYHDQIAPGTLELLRRVLAPTHEVTVRPSSMEGCGILLAQRRLTVIENSVELNTLQLQVTGSL
jgi:hypothetical protein